MLIRSLLIATLLLTLPAMAHADTKASLALGSGSEGYRTYAFQGEFAPTDTVKIGLDHFLAHATGANTTRQTGLGLTWNANKQLSLNYHPSLTDNGSIEAKGNEISLNLDLNTPGSDELHTIINLGYGDFKYAATNPVNNANHTLTQNRNSVGLSQDLTPTLTLYASHDHYRYDRNVVPLAVILIRRARNAADTLLGFPDNANTLGMMWLVADRLSLDISANKTTTLLKQEQKITRLSVDYQFGDQLTLTTALSRNHSSAIISNNGITLQTDTNDNYVELTAGWAF